MIRETKEMIEEVKGWLEHLDTIEMTDHTPTYTYADLWQAGARYCIEFFEELVIHEAPAIAAITTPVGILMKG